MEKSLRELLLQDLCARLPYGIKADCVGELIKIKYIDPSMNAAYISDYVATKWESIGVIKPYLRPMSSMTEEEKNDFREKFECAEVNPCDFGYDEGGTLEDYISTIPFILVAQVLDWLNSHYFDYRGLIPMGLALPAPEGMYE